jgi:predicted alpha/beta superfamily hydrolase
MMELRLIPGDDRLIVLPGEEGEIKAVSERIGASVLAVENLDWNRDLSPWPAEKVFRKGEDFAGHAADTLHEIEEWLRENGSGFSTVIIAGYSLAGLFALYAAAQSGRFAGCVSASGSLWFPGFQEWLAEHPLHCRTVYLSLGDQEKNARNPLMASVETKTYGIFGTLKSYTDCELKMNPGNHFNDPEGRLCAGIDSVFRRL